MKEIKQKILSQNYQVLILPVLIFFFTLAAYFIAKMFVGTWENLSNTDFMTLWLGGKSVLIGFDVYDPERWQYWRAFYGATWIFDSRFIFPLPLRVLLTPLGFFSLSSAFLIWTVVSQLIIILSIYLVYFQAREKSQFSTFLFILAGVFFFRPTYAALRFGQIGPWLMLSLALAIILWERQHEFVSGISLTFLLIKPTIGGPYIILLLFWLMVKKQWNAVIGIIVGSIGLLVLGMLQDPLWVVKFLQSGNQKLGETFAYGPNIWGFARLITDGKAVGLVGGIFCTLLIFTAYWFILKNKTLSFKEVVSIMTPVVVVTTPYLWGYDQLYLLISLCMIVILLEDSNSGYLLRSSVTIVATILSYILVLPTNIFYYDYFSVFLPLIIFVGLLLLKNRGGNKHRI